MNLNEWSLVWEDNEDNAGMFVDSFTDLVNADPALKAHRDYIEKHAYGFGERAFHWLWKLIVEDQGPELKFLEVGVYKGQVLSLVRLLAPEADITGVTMLSGFSGTGKFTPFPDEDYEQHITVLHDHFRLKQPRLVVGDSTSTAVQEFPLGYGPYDVVYVDGCHEYDYVVKDLQFYAQLIRPGGLLVVDDSACFMKQPWGYFQGIQDVSTAVLTVLDPDPTFKHLFAVMHNRVWRVSR